MKRLLLALLLMLPAPAFAADKMTVLLDWYVNPDHAPIIIAQERGFFAEQGLDVTIVPPAFICARASACWGCDSRNG